MLADARSVSSVDIGGQGGSLRLPALAGEVRLDVIPTVFLGFYMVVYQSSI